MAQCFDVDEFDEDFEELSLFGVEGEGTFEICDL